MLDDFQLVLQIVEENKVEWGTDFIVPCHLSPEISAVDMEIRWFKETDCVCLYKNRQVTEGMSYKGRVNLFTEELDRGNVSLQLRDIGQSDMGDYFCQVISTDRTAEITIRVGLLQGGSRNRNTGKGALVGAALGVGAMVAAAVVTAAGAGAGAVVAGAGAVVAAVGAGAGAGAGTGAVVAGAGAVVAAAGAAAGAAGAFFFKRKFLKPVMIQKTWSKEERKKMTESSSLAQRRNSKELISPNFSVKPSQKQE
ncbi:butyrophilin subfamily 3 member A3 [Carassius carassius]|uniref:butyrophilin subfamily 3 member A3 n=1 Tax=Carassius carassius TaxID=217509 RepID=UPI002868D364|nr:butyrophilin subfamily 3 member A3 [Carassius carassius]